MFDQAALETANCGPFATKVTQRTHPMFGMLRNEFCFALLELNPG
jgi:hypothetical protein